MNVCPSYANGPGFKKLRVDTDNEPDYSWKNVKRAGDLQENEVGDHTFVYPGAVPLEKETHGGDDVGIFATGPWAHLIHGVHEQSYIATVMSYAACIGPAAKHFNRNPKCYERRYL